MWQNFSLVRRECRIKSTQPALPAAFRRRGLHERLAYVFLLARSLWTTEIKLDSKTMTRAESFDSVSMAKTEVVSTSRHSSQGTKSRCVLSEAIVKASTILSGWNAADFIPDATNSDDSDTIVVPEAEFAKKAGYLKQAKACRKAVKWLTLITMWALQEGLSSFLTKQIVEEHLEQFKHYISVDSTTWDDFVQVFFARHKMNRATQFVQWYRHQRALGRDTWFSYEELQKATNNFSRALKVAEGNSAVVYKGIEQFSEQFIAIKRLKKVTEASLHKALYEVAVNSFIRKSFNTNSQPYQMTLVNLLGFSPYQADPLLVFEFIPNGNLRQHLQGHYGKHLHSHPSDRLRIAIDVANALKHLHFNYDSPIYHRDIKSTKILLDRCYRARLADLSKAKILRWSLEHSIEFGTTLYSMANICGCSNDDNIWGVGSPGYVDPVFQQTNQWNDLTDVYSFGVVLLELATHLKAWDDSVRPARLLTDIVKEKARGGNLSAILQPAKPGTPEGEVLKQMLFLGIDCCSLDPTSRPRIDEVERILQHLFGEWRASAGVPPKL